MRFYLVALLVLLFNVVIAQNSGFEFGRISYEDLQMKTYTPDTSAVAVVLREFGEAYVNNDRGDANFGYISFEHHLTIKILEKAGLAWGDFEIPLGKSASGDEEKWVSLEASTFNLVGPSIKESKFNKKAFFVDKQSKYGSIIKFTMPDVQVGSIIEVKYRYDSPFFFNFHSWEFQGAIPKIESEFWAKIPGNYVYNIALKGFLKLTKNESTILKECFSIGPNATADCAFYKYAIKNVPSFISEEFVFAKKNYVSAITYELSEHQSFNGNINRYTKTWETVEKDLRIDDNFGKQIKKARNQDDAKLKELVGGENDPLKKANLIYSYLKEFFVWDESNGIYTDLDYKKAYATRKGNVADINLTLVGALQAYGLDADPVILSTRRNGAVTDLYPVLSQFNYVVASVKIGDKSYLLDATDDFLPFGMIPERCINGRGRLIGREYSDWVDLKPTDRKKWVVAFDLVMNEDNTIKGTLTIQSSGYYGLNGRKEISSHASQEEYVKSLEKLWPHITIQKYTAENQRALDKPLNEKMQITISETEAAIPSIVYFNPFLLGRYESNPFKSAERSYPVDWGVPQDHTLILTLKLPASMKVDESPTNAALQLPQGGGKFSVSSTVLGEKVTMTSVISISKPVYSAGEYHSLKEFFARIVNAQQGMFVFKKK